MNFGPQIVRSGLTLYLDAANKKSYRGTGAVWRDLAQDLIFNSQGTQTPFTTKNGAPCFDFNGSGYWLCSSGFSNVDLGGDCTVIFWFYSEALAIRRTIFEKAGTIYGSYQQEIAVTWETDNTFSYYSRQSPDYDYASILSPSTNNAWNMMALKMSTGKTTTARTGFYSKNGAPWTAYYNSRSNTALVAAGSISVGNGYAGNVTDGFLSCVLCYNKMLSDSEVLQNFNATRGRFGI